MVRSTSTHINKSEMFTAIELKNILQLRCGSDSKSSNEWITRAGKIEWFLNKIVLS